MKRPANIALLYGAAAVILCCIIMLNLLKKDTSRAKFVVCVIKLQRVLYTQQQENL